MSWFAAITDLCHSWTIRKSCERDDFSVRAKWSFEMRTLSVLEVFLGPLPIFLLFLIGRPIIGGFELEPASQIHPSYSGADSFAPWTISDPLFWSMAAVDTADIIRSSILSSCTEKIFHRMSSIPGQKEILFESDPDASMQRSSFQRGS